MEHILGVIRSNVPHVPVDGCARIKMEQEMLNAYQYVLTEYPRFISLCTTEPVAAQKSSLLVADDHFRISRDFKFVKCITTWIPTASNCLQLTLTLLPTINFIYLDTRLKENVCQSQWFLLAFLSLKGTYSIGRQIDCIPCPAGQACQRTDTNQTVTCLPGTYSVGSQTVCCHSLLFCCCTGLCYHYFSNYVL